MVAFSVNPANIITDSKGLSKHRPPLNELYDTKDKLKYDCFVINEDRGNWIFSGDRQVCEEEIVKLAKDYPGIRYTLYAPVVSAKVESEPIITWF